MKKPEKGELLLFSTNFASFIVQLQHQGVDYIGCTTLHSTITSFKTGLLRVWHISWLDVATIITKEEAELLRIIL